MSSVLSSVTLTMKTGDEVVLSARHSVKTLSRPLVAKVKGAPAFKVGSDEALVLDGSRSYDPDRSMTGTSYFWTCGKVRGRTPTELPPLEEGGGPENGWLVT